MKALFADAGLRDEIGLAAVNSINWARVAAQAAYYVHAALALGAPGRAVSFVVPTGNFGNVYAGYAAQADGPPRRAARGGDQPQRTSSPASSRPGAMPRAGCTGR